MNAKRLLLGLWLGLLPAVALAGPDRAGPEDGFCAVQKTNYLQDADFALEAASRRSRHWTGIQHAGDKSFETSMHDGVLTIEKTGAQPWYLFRQRLPAEELEGKKLAFSAELKLDLRAPAKMETTVDKVGGGLFIVTRNSQGNRTLASTFDHEPNMGSSDWRPVQVVIEIPPGTRKVELGFAHKADGVLQVRKPALQEVKEPCKVTVTPPL